VEDSFVPLDEAARRMGLSEEQTLDLAHRRVLRGVDLGFGLIYVQPAILSGWRP